MICGYAGKAGRWTDLTLTDDIGMNGDGFDRATYQDLPRSDTFRDADSFPVAARLDGLASTAQCRPSVYQISGGEEAALPKLPYPPLSYDVSTIVKSPVHATHTPTATTDAPQTGPGKPTVLCFRPLAHHN